jgi:long-chain acyl-CoA synthetase
MRLLVTGGSRFDPKIGRDFYSLGIDVLQAYGLTETSGGAFVNPPGKNVIGSVGQPLKGVEAKILDPQASDDGLPASGEIIMRGPIVMKGYWNRPDATAEVLKDGWLIPETSAISTSVETFSSPGAGKKSSSLPTGKTFIPKRLRGITCSLRSSKRFA